MTKKLLGFLLIGTALPLCGAEPQPTQKETFTTQIKKIINVKTVGIQGATHCIKDNGDFVKPTPVQTTEILIQSLKLDGFTIRHEEKEAKLSELFIEARFKAALSTIIDPFLNGEEIDNETIAASISNLNRSLNVPGLEAFLGKEKTAELKQKMRRAIVHYNDPESGAYNLADIPLIGELLATYFESEAVGQLFTTRERTLEQLAKCIRHEPFYEAMGADRKAYDSFKGFLRIVMSDDFIKKIVFYVRLGSRLEQIAETIKAAGSSESIETIADSVLDQLVVATQTRITPTAALPSRSSVLDQLVVATRTRTTPTAALPSRSSERRKR